MAQICPNCGASVDDGQVFCSACGAQLPRKNVCPSCGATMQEGQSFCPFCGQRVDVPPQQTYPPPQQPYTPPQQTYPQQPYPQQTYAPKKSNAPKIIAIVLVVCLVLAAAGFGVWYFVFRESPVERIRLDQTSLSLLEGDTARLSFTLSPSDASEEGLTWRSSDRSVATVEDGKITAVSAGECTVTVTAESGVSAECEITVTPKISAENVQLIDRWSISLTYFDGEPSTFYNDAVYLELYEDMTGKMVLDDDVYEIYSWGYDRVTDGTYFYNVSMDRLGDVYFAYQNNDPSNILNDCLVLVLDADNMIVFEH